MTKKTGEYSPINKIMERHNHQSDMDKLIESKSKKSTDSLKKELERIDAIASQLRDKEFDGFKMNPRVSRKLDAYAQERVAIEVILNERK